MCLPLGGAPGDRGGVQGSGEVAVATAVEPVTATLPAAGFQRSHAGQGREGGFTADTSAARPAHQQLRSRDRLDTGLGEHYRSGRGEP